MSYKPTEASFQVTVLEKPRYQVAVRVLDPGGRPLEGAVVSVYRTLPFSKVGDWETDPDGWAYVDGLWPYAYVLAADSADGRLTTPPVHFSIPADEGKEYELTARPPPHEYEMRITTLWGADRLMEWLVENVPQIRDAIIGIPNHEFVDAWVEEGPQPLTSVLVIRFRVTGSPFPWAAIAAILAILVVIAIIGWEIREIAPYVPPTAWILLGMGIAAGGAAALASAIRR